MKVDLDEAGPRVVDHDAVLTGRDHLHPKTVRRQHMFDVSLVDDDSRIIGITELWMNCAKAVTSSVLRRRLC
jgi:hypothetical protein